MCFGVGHDVNFRLLDKMAADNGGSRNHVKPNDDIEIAVSSLIQKNERTGSRGRRPLDFGQVHCEGVSPAEIFLICFAVNS